VQKQLPFLKDTHPHPALSHRMGEGESSSDGRSPSIIDLAELLRKWPGK